MSKGNLFKALAIPAVGVGVGLEGLYKTFKGGDDLTNVEKYEKLLSESKPKRILRAIWTLVKIATVIVKVSDAVRDSRK